MPTVAVGVDGSQCSVVALRWAAAEAISRSADLRVVTVRGTVPDWPHTDLARRATMEATLQARTAEILTSSRLTLSELPTTETRFETTVGNAAEVLLALSAQVDTVVIGSRGLGPLRGALAGSVAGQLAGHTTCALVVVRDLPATPAGLIVVGVDGESSAAALQFAFDHAVHSGATVRAVWSWNEGFVAAAAPEMLLDEAWEQSYEDALAQILRPLRAQYPDVPVEPIVTHGHPVRVLAEQAHDADLLVIGSRGRGGFSSLVMGSVALGVLHDVPRPVAVVPRAAPNSSWPASTASRGPTSDSSTRPANSPPK